jgi:GrpB-like predicted nucleotidyltransferase (UPF0157 family)
MAGTEPTGRERYGAGRIVVSDHDPAWTAMFERERARVEHALGPIVVTVEHVGSTAVPGLAAKPIIDLLVGVRSLAEARSACVEPMRALHYRYMAEYETWLPNEMLFRKGPPGPWTHHVHLMEPTCARWEEFTLVRDYLRRHREVASAYADLKRALALVFGDDIAGYRNAKAPFIEAVMARARAER